MVQDVKQLPEQLLTAFIETLTNNQNDGYQQLSCFDHFLKASVTILDLWKKNKVFLFSSRDLFIEYILFSGK